MSGSFAIVEKTIVFLPLVCRIAANALLQLPQNLAVKLVTDSLTRMLRSALVKGDI